MTTFRVSLAKIQLPQNHVGKQRARKFKLCKRGKTAAIKSFPKLRREGNVEVFFWTREE